MRAAGSRCLAAVELAKLRGRCVANSPAAASWFCVELSICEGSDRASVVRVVGVEPASIGAVHRKEQERKDRTRFLHRKRHKIS